MSKNPTKGIPDGKTIRETLYNAGIRGFRKMAGYKPKVLNEDKIEGVKVKKVEEWTHFNECAIYIYTDTCYWCLGDINRFFNDWYGDYTKKPFHFIEPDFDCICPNCGNQISRIPF